MMENSTWFIIVNLNAASGSLSQRWEETQQILKNNNIDYHFEYSMYSSHSIELAREAVINGYRRFIAVGGDGTIHEVANGIFTQTAASPSECLLAAIPIGSGNDWARTQQIPINDPEAAVRVIVEGRTLIQDVGKIKFQKVGAEKLGSEASDDEATAIRYMINGAGIGFDANVCRKCGENKKKGRSGKNDYIVALFNVLLDRKCVDYKVTIDDETFFNGSVFSVAIGVGRFSGGGMIQAPKAVCNDGLLDLTLIRKVSKLTVLRHVKKLFNGEIYSVKQVSHKQFKTLKIETAKPELIEVDGEVVGTTGLEGSTGLELSIIPSSLKVITARNDI